MTEWNKCSEKLPLEDESVLAWDGKWVREAFIMYFDRDTGKPNWTYYDYMDWENVTHWMPLPKPPEGI